jgi:hypothetical protein
VTDVEFLARCVALLRELAATELGQLVAAGMRYVRRELEAERAAAPPLP